MPPQTPTQPISDSVPKINDELAVGEDLAFQERWWKFENIVWMFFLSLVIFDVAGAFGKGPLASAQAQASDGSFHMKYERVERFSTPSIIDIQFAQSAIQNGRVQLWVSDDLVRSLGNQRVIPQPLTSQMGDGGVTYTFPADKIPAMAAFALEPARVGLHHLRMRVAGMQEVKLTIFVVP